MIVDVLTGFIQTNNTRNESTSEAIKCLRTWAATWDCHTQSNLILDHHLDKRGKKNQRRWVYIVARLIPKAWA